VSAVGAAHPPGVLTVGAGLVSAPRLARPAAAAATLPQLFQPAADPDKHADVLIVDGAEPSWPRVLGRALDTPVRGVLLCEPTVVPAAEARALAARAEDAGRPVVVATPFPYDAAARNALPAFRDPAERPTLIDAVVTVRDDGDGRPARSLLGVAFLAQLAAIATITGPVPVLTMNLDTDHAYSAAGTRDGLTVVLAGLLSSLPTPSLRIDLLGVHRRHTIRLADPGPSTVVSYGPLGTSAAPPSYAGGLRGAWRNLHAAVAGAEPVRFGLRELAAVLASAAPWSR
jgi:hypothetical protein